MTLEGRGAVITGGGRGIGAACARALSARGVRVVVASRSKDELDAVAESIRGAGGEAYACTVDVTDPGSVEHLAGFAADAMGRVDILVNNAGIATSAPVHRLELSEWERTLAVNATGTFLCTRAFLPSMVAEGWGRVVNVASMAGLSGGAYIAAYAASKHAVVGFTKAVALEVAAKGVTVNAVCPGYIDTEMTRESVARIVEKTGKTPDEALAALVATSPQKRLIQPTEVAHAVVSLCAEEAAGINGETLVVDGGGLAG